MLTWGQQFRSGNSNHILSQLQQLNTIGSAMYIAAHPDDENTRLISYLVHEKHIPTTYLSLTRGDGGQNIIGNEQGKALGLIRTLEMNEARKLDGAAQLYTSAIDFGFSKNPEEVFTFWNKQKLINEVKHAIQLRKPDILILRFPTTGEGGHGQHTASAIIALEAYQQLKSENARNPQVWLPTRILFNAFSFGDRSTQKEDQLKIDINQYNHLLGKSYGELAGESRSMHKSQGAGTPQSFGIYKEYFQHLDGKLAHKDLFDDIDLTWNRIQRNDITSLINKVIQKFNPTKPSSCIPELLNIKAEISLIKDNHIKNQKLQEIDNIIIACSGITAEVLAEKSSYTKGETIHAKLNVIARYDNILLEQILIDNNIAHDKSKTIVVNHKFEHDYSYQQQLTLENVYEHDNPYWLVNNEDPNHFETIANGNIGRPIQEPKCISFLLKIDGHEFRIKVPISYKKLDPLRGDVINEVRIQPEVSIAPVSNLLFKEKNQPTTTQLRIKSNATLKDVTLGYQSDGKSQKLMSISHIRNGIDTIITIILPKDLEHNKNINYFLTHKNDTFTQIQKVLTYDHIPETQYLEKATQKVVLKDWVTKVKNIGYIQGADDLVDNVLKSMDFNVTNLEWKDFQNPNFIQQFDVIIVGIRAYNTNPEITSIHPLLMKYIEAGGTVVTQYNTYNNLKINNFGPYPFKISRKRITRENAPTYITNTSHKLLNYPNKIVGADWEDWVQERGLYYPEQWDSKYQVLISHQEFDEEPLESGILYTTFGKGHFIYTPLAFFRQLPAGNSGAIKLFMNLLSVGK